MPYKDKSNTAKAMRSYRVNKNPTKITIEVLNQIFQRAFVHAVTYPDFSRRLSIWLRDFEYISYKLSVRAETQNLKHKLDVLNELFWRLRHPDYRKGDVDIGNLVVPEDHVKLFTEEQAIIQNLYRQFVEGELLFKDKDDGWIFHLPVDKLEEEKNE